MLSELLERRELLDAHGDNMSSAFAVTLAAGDSIAIDAVIGDGSNGVGDVDMFRINLQAGDVLTAATNSNGSGLDSYLRLFGTYSSEVASNNDDPTTAPDSSLTYTAQFTGTYYLGVSSAGNQSYSPYYTTFNNSGSSSGAYHLTLTNGIVIQDPLLDVSIDGNAVTKRGIDLLGIRCVGGRGLSQGKD